MARDEAGRERNTDESALNTREKESKLLDRREYMKLAGASAAALGGIGLGASSAAAQETAGGPPSDNWELSFEDQFDSGSLDTDSWSIGFGWGRTTNSPERIVDRNVWVENEMLHLKVTHDGGPDSTYAGAVNTKNKVTYGPGTYWEARLRTPDRYGLLPAFWSKSNTEAWPPEIDFFEVLGNDPTSSHHNIHYDSTGGMGGNHAEKKLRSSQVDSTTNFHVYGCAWFEDRVEMYVDGVHVGTHDDPTAMQSLRAGAPFYMMLNIHVGRTGDPDYSESWGDQMDVDWVRVWEHNGGSTTQQQTTDDLPNTISISGGDSGAVSYRFDVTDSIKKSTARDASIDDEDSITDGVVEGAVGGGTDSYNFSGKIAGFEVDGDATVYHNGSQVDPSSLGTDTRTTTDGSDSSGGDSALPNLVVIDGSAAPRRKTTYTLSVTGDVEKDAEHGSVNAYDEISDGEVTGRIIGGKDAFRYSGDITQFDIDGAAYVSVEDNDDN